MTKRKVTTPLPLTAPGIGKSKLRKIFLAGTKGKTRTKLVDRNRPIVFKIKPKKFKPADLRGIPKPYDWRDPIMHALQTDLAVQRKIIDGQREEIERHKRSIGILIKLLTPEQRDKLMFDTLLGVKS